MWAENGENKSLSSFLALILFVYFFAAVSSSHRDKTNPPRIVCSFADLRTTLNVNLNLLFLSVIVLYIRNLNQNKHLKKANVQFVCHGVGEEIAKNMEALAKFRALVTLMVVRKNHYSFTRALLRKQVIRQPIVQHFRANHFQSR